MNASCSMFSQILKLIPRTDFERIVKETGAEYCSKGVSSWSQVVGMLFCQLGRAHSLRESEGGLKRCEGTLVPLGIATPRRARRGPTPTAAVRGRWLRRSSTDWSRSWQPTPWARRNSVSRTRWSVSTRR